MKYKIINKILDNARKSGYSDTKLLEIKYGIECIYSVTTKTLFILILAIILHLAKEMILFLIFYGILRSVGYGCHAKSNLVCWIVSPIILILFPYLSKITYMNNLISIILWTISFICFYLFCPADTKKKPMINKKRKLKLKILLLIISLIYLIVLINFKDIRSYIVYSMLLESLVSSPLGYILMGQEVRFDLNEVVHLNIFKKGVN